MEITRELMKAVAGNAHLELTEQEIDELLPQLNDVLAAFSKISKAEFRLKPSFHPVELKNVLREDIADISLSQDDALSQTRHRKDGYFKGPRVL